MKKAPMLAAIQSALLAGMSADQIRNSPEVHKFNREENQDKCFSKKLAKRRANNKLARKARRLTRLRA